MIELKNLRISEIISDYCVIHKKSLLYFECKKDDKSAVVEFYTGKACVEFVQAMKYDDDCFFEFKDHNTAISWAEVNFPTLREIVGEYGDDTFYIEATVYDTDGLIRWSNKLAPLDSD